MGINNVLINYKSRDFKFFNQRQDQSVSWMVKNKCNYLIIAIFSFSVYSCDFQTSKKESAGEHVNLSGHNENIDEVSSTFDTNELITYLKARKLINDYDNYNVRFTNSGIYINDERQPDELFENLMKRYKINSRKSFDIRHSVTTN
ncbi:hypothetical protein [Sphingobacterium multivorum]|uniref:hypothetical protein n=1 Tax=Sphingobacterium multivorum TaxID=28454 RepID=UPI000B490E17|nr:hypothetical protein [Sphingobacterium multivorum]